MSKQKREIKIKGKIEKGNKSPNKNWKKKIGGKKLKIIIPKTTM